MWCLLDGWENSRNRLKLQGHFCTRLGKNHNQFRSGRGTLNQRVQGSSPCAPTSKINHLTVSARSPRLSDLLLASGRFLTVFPEAMMRLNAKNLSAASCAANSTEGGFNCHSQQPYSESNRKACNRLHARGREILGKEKIGLQSRCRTVHDRLCEGFQMPAVTNIPHGQRPASENLQGTKPREGARISRCPRAHYGDSGVGEPQLSQPRGSVER